jgi:hypothetical protein
MTGLAGFLLKSRNPDVLTCIAKLSNNEVVLSFPRSGVGMQPRTLQRPVLTYSESFKNLGIF